MITAMMKSLSCTSSAKYHYAQCRIRSGDGCLHFQVPMVSGGNRSYGLSFSINAVPFDYPNELIRGIEPLFECLGNLQPSLARTGRQYVPVQLRVVGPTTLKIQIAHPVAPNFPGNRGYGTTFNVDVPNDVSLLLGGDDEDNE